MSVRDILPYPDARLKQKAAPVGKVDDATRALWDDLNDTIHANNLVGMAAPQIGVGLRVAVVDCSISKNEPLFIADPEIIFASQEMQSFEEGSPNLPGVYAKVERSKQITFTYLDRTGMRVRKDVSELWATSLQHQIDHMDGKLFFDRLGAVKRKMVLAKAAKIAKKGAR